MNSDYEDVLREVREQHPEENPEQQEARARYRIEQHVDRRPPRKPQSIPSPEYRPSWWVIAWGIAVLLLLGAIAAKAEPDERLRLIHAVTKDALVPPSDGIILQLRNQGAVLATRPAGLLVLNCSTNMSCSFSGSTFTITSSATAGTAWSSLTAPTVNLSMAHGAFTTTFTYNAATGAGIDLFNIVDTTGNTGTGHLFGVNTVGTSSAKPVRFTAGGTTNGIEMDTTGQLNAIGTGNINATKCVGVTCMSNPMTGFGDIIYGAAGGAATRLAAGTDGQVLLTHGVGVAPTFGDPIVSPNQDTASTAAWTSVTALNTALSVAVSQRSTVTVSFNGATITAGAITFEVSPDNTTWYAKAGVRGDAAAFETTYTLSGANQSWTFAVGGYTNFRVRLSTVITGAGTANINVIPQALGSPNLAAVLANITAALPIGANTIGAVNLAQYTPVAGRLPVDGSAVTQPISAASLPLPAGAAQEHVTAASPHATRLTDGTAFYKATTPADTQPVSLAAAVDVSDRIGRLVGQIVGTVASGGADSGNPLKIGGVFNTTQPTVTTGQRVDAQFSARGELLIAKGVSGFSIDNTSFNVGTFPANQPFNVAQWGGIAVLAGNGVTGTGSPRVTVASDNSNAPGVGGSATAAAVPAAARYIAGNASGNLTGVILCDKSAVISTAATGSTQLVALIAGQTIYVCSYNWMANGAVNVKLLYGTGVACATGPVDLTGAYNHTAQTGIAVTSPSWTGIKTAAANALCINLSAAIQVSGVVTYTQF